MDLKQYSILEEDSDRLLLQDKSSNLFFYYREYEIPKFIGRKQIIPTQQLLDILQARKLLSASNVVSLLDFSLTSKICLIFEQPLKNFDEELVKRRNTTQFWSEEELYNTFQACLAALKAYHDHEITHGSISPKSIIFSQDSQVKLADNFVVADEFKRNWRDKPDNDDYGYWPPEVVNFYDGWKYKYETIENDIWALGIVFLEAMTLKSGFDFYFLDNNSRLYIDFQLIQDGIASLSQMYSQDLVAIIQIMLSIDPLERSWERIIAQNLKIQDTITNKLPIQPIPEESEEDSQTFGSTHRSEQVEVEKNRLLNMLESCLLKSRQLIHENESRKSKRPSCENVVVSQHSPSKEDLNSSLLMLMRGKHSKKNSTDSNASVLKEIPQNKQRPRPNREGGKKERLVNPSKAAPGAFDPNDLSNLQEQYKSYYGETRNGKMHGNGQLTFKNGAVLQGSFKEGKINGYGILVVNGEIVVGNWEGNLLTQII